MTFLEEGKQLVWRNKFTISEAFRAALEERLLANLARVGEITRADREWARAQVRRIFDDQRFPEKPE
jgi:hypothetical protein